MQLAYMQDWGPPLNDFNMYYVLDGKTSVPVAHVLEWARMFEQSSSRIVAKDDLPGGIHVSTVFLGIDHRYGCGGPPILFETMIFGGKHDQYQERYCTWEDAESGHVLAVALADGDRWNWFVALWMRLQFSYQRYRFKQFMKPENLKRVMKDMKKLITKLKNSCQI